MSKNLIVSHLANLITDDIISHANIQNRRLIYVKDFQKCGIPHEKYSYIFMQIDCASQIYFDLIYECQCASERGVPIEDKLLDMEYIYSTIYYEIFEMLDHFSS